MFRRRIIFSSFILLIFLLLSGCNLSKEANIKIEKDKININAETEEVEKNQTEKIIRFSGVPSGTIDQVYTTDKILSLTLNGLVEEDKMNLLLKKLAEVDIQASFFLDQKQVQENTEMIQNIINQGHTIENSVFNQYDLSEKSYEDIYIEVKYGNEIIKEVSGHQPKFTRTKPWKKNKDLELITAQLEMESVIGHSARPRDRDLEDMKELANYFKHSLSRGGIISLDVSNFPQILHSIDYIVKEASFIDYSIVPLTNLVQMSESRLPFEDIEGNDLIKENLDYENEEPNVLYSKATDEKVVALTFDDYGSDKTVLEILNILETYDIESTFFLKAKNVMANPNLAKVILDEGHEIANHSYSHLRSTELTPKELQEDLIKAHKIITEAIQEKPTMLFRPPFGNIDAESAKVMSAVGFQNIAMYDVSSYDWNPDYTVDDVINRVMTGVEPGSVIVMHILDNIKNIETLPIIIDKLQAKGYSFVKMSEWFEEV